MKKIIDFMAGGYPFSKEIRNVLESELKKYHITLISEENTLKKFNNELDTNLSTYMPNIPIQFIALLDSINKKSIIGTQYGYIPFYYETEDDLLLLTIGFVEFDVFLLHKRINERTLNSITRIWEEIYEIVAKKDAQIRQKEFLNDEASVINIYPSIIESIAKKEVIIDDMMEQYRENSMFLVLSSSAFDDDVFVTIYEYILEVFSLIEFIGNSLLPFWENSRTEEWITFISLCKNQNPEISKWVDLFDEEKTRYSTGRILKDGKPYEYKTPIPINIVDLFFRALRKRHQSIADEYFRLKTIYRNTVSHGNIGTHYNYGIGNSLNVVDATNMFHVEKIGYDALSIPLIDLDFHSFVKTKNFLNQFISLIETNYPAFYTILKSARVFPYGIDMELFKDLANVKNAKQWLLLSKLIRLDGMRLRNWDLLISGELIDQTSKDYKFKRDFNKMGINLDLTEKEKLSESAFEYYRNNNFSKFDYSIISQEVLNGLRSELITFDFIKQLSINDKYKDDIDAIVCSDPILGNSFLDKRFVDYYLIVSEMTDEDTEKEVAFYYYSKLSEKDLASIIENISHPSYILHVYKIYSIHNMTLEKFTYYFEPQRISFDYFSFSESPESCYQTPYDFYLTVLKSFGYNDNLDDDAWHSLMENNRNNIIPQFFHIHYLCLDEEEKFYKSHPDFKK